MEPVARNAVRLPTLPASIPASAGLSQAFQAVSQSARAKRAELFRTAFELTERTRILDLGSETGANIHAVLRGTPVQPGNVHICDIHKSLIETGARRYGYVPVLATDDQPLPFAAGYFDIVYCSSVIEHVTLPKAEVWREWSGRRFAERAARHQAQFAAQIRRLGRQYFVQTPYVHFPVESHTWLPFVAWLPRPLLLPVLRLSNAFWIKSTNPDWLLLDRRDMAVLFPDAELREEKLFGLTKSLIAVKSDIA